MKWLTHNDAQPSGYTANASAIKLGTPAPTEAAAEAIHAVIRGVLAEAEPNTAAEALSSHHERDPALVTAVVFFLVAKFTRVAILA